MFFDFDNDGWPDLILVNGHVYPEVDKYHLGSNYQEPRLLYHNNGNGTFTDISDSAGAGITTACVLARPRHRRSVERWPHFSSRQQHECAPSLLVNQARTNHWITFHLTGAYPTGKPSEAKSAAAQAPAGNGSKSTRDAIGARIKVKTGGRTLVDEVRSGSSFISHNDMRVHFGLGAATKIDSVEVRWPSGLLETFPRVSADKLNELKEGSGTSVK